MKQYINTKNLYFSLALTGCVILGGVRVAAKTYIPKLVTEIIYSTSSENTPLAENKENCSIDEIVIE